MSKGGITASSLATSCVLLHAIWPGFNGPGAGQGYFPNIYILGEGGRGGGRFMILLIFFYHYIPDLIQD